MSVTQWAPVGRRAVTDMPLTKAVSHWLTSMTNAPPCPFNVDVATTAIFLPDGAQPNLFIFDPSTRRVRLIPSSSVSPAVIEMNFGSQGGGGAVIMQHDVMTPSFDEFGGGAAWAQIAAITAEAGLRRPSESLAEATNRFAQFGTFGQGAGGIAINRNLAAKPPQPPSRHAARNVEPPPTADSPAIYFHGHSNVSQIAANNTANKSAKAEGDCDTPPALSAVAAPHSNDTHAISMGTPLPPARFGAVPAAIFFSERPDPSTTPASVLITAEVLSTEDISVLIRRKHPVPHGVLVSLRSEQQQAHYDRYTPIHGLNTPATRDFVAYAVVPSTGSYVDPASAQCHVEEWTSAGSLRSTGAAGGRGTPNAGESKSLTALHLPFPPLRLRSGSAPSPTFAGAREPSPYLGAGTGDQGRVPLPIAQGTMITGLAAAAAVTVAEALLRREGNLSSNSTCAMTLWLRSNSSGSSPCYTVVALPSASINGESLTAFSWMDLASVTAPSTVTKQAAPLGVPVAVNGAPPPTGLRSSNAPNAPGGKPARAQRPVSASTRRSSPGRKVEPGGDSPAYTAMTNSPPRRFGAQESKEGLDFSASHYPVSPRERCCPNCHRLLGEQRQPPAAMSVPFAITSSRPTSAKSAATTQAATTAIGGGGASTAAPPGAPVTSASKVVPVRYVAIAEWMQRQQRAVQKGLERLIPATVPPLPRKRKDGRTVLAPRPRSARHASDPVAVAQLPHDAACFEPTHEWAKMPPVLERLNVPLEEILERPVWATRTVNLCGTCANKFAPVTAAANEESMAVATVNKSSARSRDASPERSAVAKPPPCLTSDVIDCIALTDLQAQHRTTRRVQREKFEMRLVALECADHEARPSTPVREAANVEELIESFAGTDATITTADAPLSWSLCSELFYAMLRVCALPPEPELGAVVSRPARGNTNAGRFQAPDVLVATELDLLASHDEDTDDGDGRQMSQTVSENISYRSLAKTSHTFAQMRHAERQLIVKFVGSDKHHVAGLVLGTGGHDTDPTV